MEKSLILQEWKKAVSTKRLEPDGEVWTYKKDHIAKERRSLGEVLDKIADDMAKVPSNCPKGGTTCEWETVQNLRLLARELKKG